MTDHVSACRCIWCASDPDKVRECGAPHPYAGSACARPSGHTGGHGNSHRAWLAEAEEFNAEGCLAPQGDATDWSQS